MRAVWDRNPHRTRVLSALIRPLALLTLTVAAAVACGCGTGHPVRLGTHNLSEAQAFPYFRLYWVGPRFEGHPLTAVDGRQDYNSSIGDSVYYGDCNSGRKALGGGSCGLPLQVSTVIYRLHSNAALGSQRNTLIRGVPATIYDSGRSIELYSGRVAIDVFSGTPAGALLAAEQLKPLNAPAERSHVLPPPVYCPGLTGAVAHSLRVALERLPGRPCQRARAALAAMGRSAEALTPRY